MTIKALLAAAAVVTTTLTLPAAELTTVAA